MLQSKSSIVVQAICKTYDIKKQTCSICAEYYNPLLNTLYDLF